MQQKENQFQMILNKKEHDLKLLKDKIFSSEKIGPSSFQISSNLKNEDNNFINNENSEIFFLKTIIEKKKFEIEKLMKENLFINENLMKFNKKIINLTENISILNSSNSYFDKDKCLDIDKNLFYIPLEVYFILKI